ncbi:hypothetical protein GOP47_0007669 [Adiantum capillus-veneris]|uniref:Peptidase metallopeptidase domain-containing protein n=1 Tax=Adiantum capillus-veneris TaxID=13818 RepID=A0A9D4ZM66_ADICA|nr:hypothetical protein GOP47_0007669 [Adiantum capillus-veneris]
MQLLSLFVILGHLQLSSLFLLTEAARPLPFPSILDKLPPALHQYTAGVWGHFKSLLNAGLGDSRGSLAPLKRYFAHFGYLNLSSSTNVTALFDDSTLAALRLYQQSFNLPISGKLDMPTLLKIMTPRCGREDVANGVPLMLQQPPSSPHSDHPMAFFSTVGHYSFFPSTPSWPSTKRNLTYAFNSMNETQRLSPEQRRQAFANAFSEWAAVVPMNFTEITNYEAADIKIEFVSFDHGDEEPFDGVLGILAHAFSPTDGRFHLDNSEFWFSASAAAGDNNMTAQEVDLQSVVTHEIGHLIGLAHSPEENAIMYPSLGPRQVKLQLQPDDIQGAQALYGANPNFNPNTPLPGIPPIISHSVEDVNVACTCTFLHASLVFLIFFLSSLLAY